MTSLSNPLETGRCIKWCTELPNAYTPRRSSEFLLLDRRCSFLFVRESSNSGCLYRVYVKPATSTSKFPSFVVEVHVGFRKSSLATDIFSGTTRMLIGASEGMHEIWCMREDCLISKAKFDTYDGTPLRFVFIFDRHIVLKLQNETGDRSVQTTISTSRRVASVQTPFSRNPDTVHVGGAKSCLEHLSDDFCKLLAGDADHDAVLRSGGCTIRAHKSILRARSSVFEALLTCDVDEGKTSCLELHDMDEVMFQEFVRYLYSGTIPELSWDSARKLFAAGDQYAVEGLKQKCSSFLVENLKPENACECLALADVHCASDLKERVISYILDNGIPLLDDQWLPFVSEHSLLAAEVLRRFYRLQKQAS